MERVEERMLECQGVTRTCHWKISEGMKYGRGRGRKGNSVDKDGFVKVLVGQKELRYL